MVSYKKTSNKTTIGTTVKTWCIRSVNDIIVLKSFPSFKSILSTFLVEIPTLLAFHQKRKIKAVNQM